MSLLLTIKPSSTQLRRLMSLKPSSSSKPTFPAPSSSSPPPPPSPTTSTPSTAPAASDTTSSPGESSPPRMDASKPLTLAEQDALAHQRLLERDGGQTSLSTEDGAWTGLKSNVKNNMFRVI
ncbi:hypothetical protein BDY24DRAFT_380422 [Mrakia frigida]|uniref:uncharacterized protein n=1 Tax=Mrakia frigida TaxID=29902 RepID=UPI003FCC1811